MWQDRRTTDLCGRLRAEGQEKLIADTTGLLVDPYFSATKICWLLDNVAGARARAERGELAFGTVDSYLIWRLTGGKAHVTDATNASRTMLFDIRRGQWSEDLLKLFRVPVSMLPEVRDCAAEFGVTDPSIFGIAVPVRGVAGDQQAAMVGQACFEPGMLKSTYGTGCFALLNTGLRPVASRHRLLTTIAYQLGGERTYALEGSIFAAGAAVQWLRDGLGALQAASESGSMAAEADPAQDVVLVPAFVGLGAPYWNAEARGALFGLTRATGRKELARAALESVCFQTVDLLDAMREDWATSAPLCCGSMGAWLLPTGQCNGSRISSTRPLIDPKLWKRPRLARPILQVCRRASIRSRVISPRAGRSAVASCRKWRPQNEGASSTPGAMRSAA